MKTLTVIQARMASQRLPGKVLAPIAGKPMLWHVVERAKQAGWPVTVASGRHIVNEPIESLCRQYGWSCYRGSDENVLERVYCAANESNADTVVRITGDCPLIDPKVMQLVMTAWHEAPNVELVTNSPDKITGYPDGMDVEIFSFEALHEAFKKATDLYDLEHVTSWLRANCAMHFVSWDGPPIRPLKWSVDQVYELDWVRSVYDGIGRVDFGMHDVLRWLKGGQEP